MKYLCLFLSIILFWGCSAEKETIPVPKIEIISSEIDQVLSSDGGIVNITFSAGDSWVVEAFQPWCTISSSKGDAGQHTIQINVDANDTYDERNARVVLTCGTVTEEFVVVQKQKDAILLTSSKIEMSADGGDVSIEVQSNVAFEYIIDEKDKEWIQSKEGMDTRGLNVSTLLFTASENTSKEKREGTITICSGELSEVVKIYQEGMDPSIILTQNEYTISSGEEMLKVELKSNTNYKVEIVPADVKWITESQTRSMSSYTHYFNITENTDYDSREAYIVFVDSESGVEEQIHVVQMQKDAIIVARNEYNIEYQATTLTFDVNTNIELSVACSVDWIKQIQTRGLHTETLNFSVEENATKDSREGIIILKNGDVKQEIKITQQGYRYIALKKDSYIVEHLGNTIAVEVNSNVEYSIQLPEDGWITLNQNIPSEPNVHYFDVAPVTKDFNVNDNRRGNIIFFNREENIQSNVEVFQLHMDAIIHATSTGYDGNFAPDTIFLGYQQNSTTFRHIYTSMPGDLIIENNVNWISVKQDAEGYIEFSVTEENPNEQNRIDDVFFRKGELVQKVRVIQDPRPIKVGNYYAIDLGLSTKWALHNVGAFSEEETGGLYGWADPTGIETTSKVFNEDGYWVSPLYGGPNPPSDICGTTLDIATVKWGADWRLPSYEEQLELWFNCGSNNVNIGKYSNTNREIKWITYKGVEGIQFISYNGNCIFLPAAGWREDGNVYTKYRDYAAAYYWSGTLSPYGSYDAMRLNCDAFWAESGASGGEYHFLDNMTSGMRYWGYSVRPVTK